MAAITHMHAGASLHGTGWFCTWMILSWERALPPTPGDIRQRLETCHDCGWGCFWHPIVRSHRYAKSPTMQGRPPPPPHLPHPTRNTSSKMAISLLLNPPGVMILGAVLCLHKCAMWTLMYNRELSPYTSCTSSEPHSVFPAALSDMFAHGVSDWWVDRCALPCFPMGAYACASSNRFFLQLWSENFFNHKDFTMDIFIELTL